MYEKYTLVDSLEAALVILAENPESCRVISGGTDLVLEIEKGQHKQVKEIIDISRIEGLDQIWQDEKGLIHLGALVTHNHCVKSTLVRNQARCLAEACYQVGSPQIRNRGTIVGNLVTASPANDTISALLTLDAKLVIVSKRALRVVALGDFFMGVRKTKLEKDELVSEIVFKPLSEDYKSVFTKNALRRAQAISVLNVSCVTLNQNGIVKDVRIALGAVAPTVIRASAAEEFLIGKPVNQENIQKAAEIAAEGTRPIDDLRASLKYRQKMVGVLVRRALEQTLLGQGEPLVIEDVVLWGKNESTYQAIKGSSITFDKESVITVTVNGLDLKINGAFHKNLLDLLRENALLTGTKEGCGEGECGACTVFMDGVAVMACLVPAPRANETKVVTVEGITGPDVLHKVQQAFIEEGAVQCGYCTPGFVMSAVKLLEEKARPSQNEIKIGLSGNLCRCTGYYKIISAVEKAAKG